MAAPVPQPDIPFAPSARGRALLLLAFVIVYAAACSLPALYLTGRRDSWSGVEVMVLGPFGLQIGQFAWLANVAAALALWLVMKGRPGPAIFSGVMAFVLGLHTLWLPGTEVLLGSEPFNSVQVVSVGPGYFVWMAAMLVPLAAAFLLRQPRPTQRED